MNKPIDPQLFKKITADSPSQWDARLSLRFEQRKRGVRLVKSEHEGPLYVQKAFYPEGPDCAHAYLLHPPGGLVSGDTLEIDISVGEGSHALITTPGAGRVYRAREDESVQTQNMNFQVESGGVLEWLPLETILFPASHARMNTRIDLAENAKVMTWEVTCFGLPANQEIFERGTCQQRLQIWQEGRIKLNEGLVLQDADGCLGSAEGSIGNAKAGLQGLPVNALLVAGPFSNDSGSRRKTELSPELSAALITIQENTKAGEYFAASLVGDFLSVRYLGTCTERARALLSEAWAVIRPELVERKAIVPRIWLT